LSSPQKKKMEKEKETLRAALIVIFEALAEKNVKVG
jgi:hypothetical protein